VVRIPAPEIENSIANAVGAHLAAQADAIDGCHIDRGDGRGDYAITQHKSGRMRRDLLSENDVRNAIDRATVSATRIEIVLAESIVVNGQDRVLTPPWARASSRRRREIIQGVGEAQGPLRAMRTKARDSFIGALGDGRRWLDELLIDPAQTIESLAMREHKSERSLRKQPRSKVAPCISSNASNQKPVVPTFSLPVTCDKARCSRNHVLPSSE
jgi:hypothetical protein